MILTADEYSKIFKLKNRIVSAMTVKRRCSRGQLPTGHKSRKLPGPKGAYVIEVPDNVQLINTIKK
jgi:hypothetical protein